ncbi:hypothetical protein SDC9_190664 [bioreactor metagenome]|uniref:Uncharacterized protein n=1 Tax=bioreactor metagenome TaxID=1076179 RepID=A0A645HVL8_9ZZZZ
MTADNFLISGLLANLIVNNPCADPVYPHIRGRLIHRVIACNFRQDLFQEIKGFNITIVIYGFHAICFQVIRVYHVYIA